MYELPNKGNVKKCIVKAETITKGEKPEVLFESEKVATA
jgi:ATP-dependent protease Clp ATPase subunit